MKTALIFPGQGSQYVGMGQACYRASSDARRLFEQADSLLGYSLSRLCFVGPSGQLNETAYTQPALFVTSMALWVALREYIAGDIIFAAGHSVGEFVALCMAGVMSFPDGLQIVATRGQLMQNAGKKSPGGMAVLLGATLEAAESLCKDVSGIVNAHLVVANDNCPGQVVISGALGALELAMERAGDYGIRRVRRLDVSVAPHSLLMAPVQEPLAQALATVPLREPQIPLVFNATARPASDLNEVRQLLLKQLTSPVRWREGLLWMVQQGVERFVEIGPGAVLSGMVRRAVSPVQSVAADDMVSGLGW
ncbi:MAG: ACP S-malonyltransferase [Anaerolineae bacterium]|nr:ACP S-malonyltransferase [Anaerolineae bacterium]